MSVISQSYLHHRYHVMELDADVADENHSRDCTAAVMENDHTDCMVAGYRTVDYSQSFVGSYKG